MFDGAGTRSGDLRCFLFLVVQISTYWERRGPQPQGSGSQSRVPDQQHGDLSEMRIIGTAGLNQSLWWGSSPAC